MDIWAAADGGVLNSVSTTCSTSLYSDGISSISHPSISASISRSSYSDVVGSGVICRRTIPPSLTCPPSGLSGVESDITGNTQAAVTSVVSEYIPVWQTYPIVAQ